MNLFKVKLKPAAATQINLQTQMQILFCLLDVIAWGKPLLEIQVAARFRFKKRCDLYSGKYGILPKKSLANEVLNRIQSLSKTTT